MGSFDVACAVSGLHIGVGDKCLTFQIAGTKLHPFLIEDLILTMGKDYLSAKNLVSLNRDFKEECTRYGLIPPYSSIRVFDSSVPFFAYGTYSDYGDVDIEDGRSWGSHSESLDSFYVAEEIVKYIMTFHREDYGFDGVEEHEPLLTLLSMTRFCYLNRHPLYPHYSTRGGQCFEPEELSAQTGLAELKLKLLKQKRKALYESKFEGVDIRELMGTTESTPAKYKKYRGNI